MSKRKAVSINEKKIIKKSPNEGANTNDGLAISISLTF